MNICSFTVLLLVLAIALVCRVNVSKAIWTDLDLIASGNSKSGAVQTNFHIKRTKEKTFVVDGPLVLTKNLNGYECEMKLSYSSKGNNEFRLLPYKVRRQNCCTFFESWFYVGIQKELDRISDMPKRNKNERICVSYVKGNYTVNQLIFDKNTLPKFLYPAMYKATLLYYIRNTARFDSKLEFIARLY